MSVRKASPNVRKLPSTAVFSQTQSWYLRPPRGGVSYRRATRERERESVRA
jgi:hypothetical protein